MSRPSTNQEDISRTKPTIDNDVVAEESTSLIDSVSTKAPSFSTRRHNRFFFVSGALVIITAVAGAARPVLHILTVSSTPAVPKIKDDDYSYHGFPEDFIWGAATSSYQIKGATHEGGRGRSIWDTFCDETNKIADRSNGDVACDHYHRMEGDVQLLKSLGIRAYRFSIAWTRIFPTGKGDINPEGVAFYNRLINELLKNDIEPWVTLYHWDLPLSLQDEYGGWHSPKIVDDFSYYATACFRLFGDRVKNWITLNEPWSVAVQGYEDGSKPPGIIDSPQVDVYLVGHHLLLAHAKAYQIYKKDFAPTQYGKVGISNCGDWRYPLDPDSKADQDAAERSMVFQYAWLTDPLVFGDYPKDMRDRLGERLPNFTTAEQNELKGALDFMGLNHYSTLYASARKEKLPYGGYWSDMDVDFSSDPSWKKNFMNWSTHPYGCFLLLQWIAARYPDVPILITENGSCEDEPNLDTAIHDEGRRSYFEGYIRACGEAIDAGVNFKGYFIWSLMDNFEWEYGYTRRFGIYYVNFDTLERTGKSSALWYRDMVAANGSNLPTTNIKGMRKTELVVGEARLSPFRSFGFLLKFIPKLCNRARIL